MRVNTFIPSPEIFNNIKNENNSVSDNKGIFKEKLDELNDIQVAGNNAVEDFMNGDIDVHQMMLATEEAKLSLQLAVQVRNKIIDAVQELSRMQL